MGSTSSLKNSFKEALISPFTLAANQFSPPTDSLQSHTYATLLIQQFLSYALLSSSVPWEVPLSVPSTRLSEQKSCSYLSTYSKNCQPLQSIYFQSEDCCIESCHETLEKGLKLFSLGLFSVRFRRINHDTFTEGQVWLEVTSSLLATLFFGNPVVNNCLSRSYNIQVKSAVVFKEKNR